MVCPECGRENRSGESSCCYCLAALNIDIESLFQAVQKGNFDPQTMVSSPKTQVQQTNITEKTSMDGSDELVLLESEVLVPIPPRKDYSSLRELFSALEKTRNRQEEHDILRGMAKEALRLSRGIGRNEPMSWGNKSLALVVQGVKDEGAWKEIMEMLDVPRFLANFLAKNRSLEIISHSASRVDLHQIALSYQQKFSSAAIVLSQEQLLQEPPPMACLGVRGANFRIVDAPLWRQKDTGLLEEELRAQVRLAVIGMVEEQTFRDAKYQEIRSFGRRKTELQRTKHQEKKVGVIDLHCDDIVIRIVEGVCDFSTLPGYEKGALRKSFQNLVSLLSVWLDGVQILPQKTFRVREVGGDEKMVSAWKDWERYSYCARCMLLRSH